MWNDLDLVEDVKQEILLYLEQLYQNHAPEFIYYKTLFHIFEQYLDDQARADLLSVKSQIVDADIWNMLFEFQKDGVKGAINKILRHNGCIIADSVGLGKTFEALAIIKYFELLNYKALVLCPKKLRENWTVYQAQNNSELNPFINDRFAYTVLCHTDLSRDGGLSGDINLATINWGNYDLVVIDESHNFRNNIKGKRDEDGNVIRKSRYERLMEDIIKTGVKTRVLLISATPVNNDLKDLRNQLYFLTEEKEDAFKESLGITSLRDTLATAQRTFTEWTKQNKTHQTSELLGKLSSAFFKLLDELTIARSRKHIHRYYADSIAELGGFPERLKPISIVAEIDNKRRFMSYDRLNDEISQYRLSLFNPSMYVLPQYQAQYEQAIVKNFRQSDRENYLIGMMKVNFLKRLESSVHSFAITMGRTIEKIEALQQRIERFQQVRAENPELDFDDLGVEAFEDEELQEAMQVGEKFLYNMAHLDLVKWLQDLKKDLDGIQQQFRQDHDLDMSESNYWNWVVRFTKEAIRQCKDFKPEVGDTWVADETYMKLGDKTVYFWDIIDSKTNYLLASHVSFSRGGRDARVLMRLARVRAGKYPKTVVTDKLKSYISGVGDEYGTYTEHRQGGPFKFKVSGESTAEIERFHKTLEQRTEVFQKYNDIDTIRLLTSGWLINYNFFKQNEGCGNIPPAQVMSRVVPFKDWNDVVIPEGTSDKDYLVSLHRRKSVKKGKPVYDARLIPLPADTKESA